MTRKISRTLVATLAACLLAFSSTGYARTIEESPSALAMTTDPCLSPCSAAMPRKPAKFWLWARPEPPLFAAWAAPAPAARKSR